MKFSVKQAVLQKLLATTTKAISNKIITPILSGIKFDITDDKILLTGSSNNLMIVSEYLHKDDFNVDTAGSFILPSRYISEIVRKTTEEWIHFEMIDTNLLLVSTRNAEFNLNCFNLQEYPNTYFIDNETSFTIDSTLLYEIINQTVFCISQNESRPVLTGINFRISGKELVVVGSDSFRLAQKKTFIKPNDIMSQNLIIPGKTAHELAKILNELKEPTTVKIHVSPNKLLFKFNNLKIQTNLVDGNYPETARAIPENFETEIQIDKALLLHAVDVASLLSRDVHNNIVNLKITDTFMEISSLSEEVGKVKEELPLVMSKGKPFTIAVNAQFIIDSLKIIVSETVNLKFNDGTKPFIIETSDDPSLIQLVVPLKTH